jgi:hypothetical protein
MKKKNQAGRQAGKGKKGGVSNTLREYPIQDIKYNRGISGQGKGKEPKGK